MEPKDLNWCPICLYWVPTFDWRAWPNRSWLSVDRARGHKRWNFTLHKLDWWDSLRVRDLWCDRLWSWALWRAHLRVACRWGRLIASVDRLGVSVYLINSIGLSRDWLLRRRGDSVLLGEQSWCVRWDPTIALDWWRVNLGGNWWRLLRDMRCWECLIL